MQQNKHKVLVTLDSLMDTRIASVAKLSSALAEQLLMSGEYHLRRHNNFALLIPGIDTPRIDSIYKKRDMGVLRMSVMTEIVNMLYGLAVEARAAVNAGDSTAEISITVNTYPYDIPEDELVALVYAMGKCTTVTAIDTVHKPYSELTPEYVKQYDSFIMDDIEDWLPLHAEALIESGMKGVLVYAPEIIRSGWDTIDTIPEAAPGTILSITYAPYMDIEILPLRHYSVPSNTVGILSL